MFEMPNYPIAHPQAKFRENRIEHGVQGNDGASIDIIPNLPTDAPALGETPNTLLNDLGLLGNVFVELEPLFVFFANVVGR